jgi:hypothetical protein
MILGKAAASKPLAARALEGEAGGVHEHQMERAEEIAPPREQGLFHDVFEATRREGRSRVLLIFRQFPAEPSHRAVKMMQIEALDAPRSGNPASTDPPPGRSRPKTGDAER